MSDLPSKTEKNDLPSPRRLRMAIIAALAVVAAVLAARGFASGTSSKGDIEDNRFLLDTIVSVKIYESDDLELLDAAFDAIEVYENALSRHQEGSEVSMINENSGAPLEVSQETFNVLGTALDYAILTEGAFDPTVGPLVDLWGIGSDGARVPEEAELEEVLALVDYRLITADAEGKTVNLEKEGMELDLGGVAKGWIADRVADLLLENGAEHVLINLGGNVRVAGGKPGGEAFRIGMQDPDDDRGAYLGVFTLADGSVVSSGVYERFFEEDGIRYHHILDTVSGYPVDNGLAAVTVISDLSVDGDALSTSLFALGLEDGLVLAGSLEGIEAAFVTSAGKVFMTPGAAEMFSPSVSDLEIEVIG